MSETSAWEHAGVHYGVRYWRASEEVCASGPSDPVDASLRETYGVVHGAADGVSVRCAPIVLLHGFAQSAAAWDEVARDLAHDRTVYALDLIGHGSSDRPANPQTYAPEAQAQAVLAFLHSVAADEGARPVVIGYSMGGRVALMAATLDPDAFAANASALILEGAGLGPATSDEREQAAARDAANAGRLRTEGVSAFMDAWERLPLFATQCDLPAITRERQRAARLNNDAEALARTFEHAGQHAMPSREQTCAALVALSAQGFPVLYLAGGRDEKYRALASRLAADALCETRTLDSAGHNTHLEAPTAFVRKVNAFLSASDAC